eukprot:Awhi_evm2s150
MRRNQEHFLAVLYRIRCPCKPILFEQLYNGSTFQCDNAHHERVIPVIIFAFSGFGSGDEGNSSGDNLALLSFLFDHR